MTTAILVLGIGLALASAIVMLRPEWRLPAFAFILLALPGNVDDLLPQMRLDPHELVNGTAAAVSVVDLLLLWAVILTVRDGRRLRIPAWLFAVAGILTALAVLAAAVAVARGVEPLAGVRGAIVFVRILAVLFLAGSLVESRRDAVRIGLAITAGGAALIGNGLYTSTSQDLDRFTATTFGRNTFAIALIICAIVAAGVVFSLWDRRRASGRETLIVVASAFIAAACLFAAVATGTRMSLVALVGAGVLVLILSTSWRSMEGLRRVGVVAAVTIAIIASAGVLTPGGARALSVVTAAEEVARGVTDRESLPIYSEIRSRGDFWALAIRMAVENPSFGVGPFQWNIQRYDFAEYEPLVADPHNSYLQVAAEYGIPPVAFYVLLIAACLLLVVLASWRPTALSRTDWLVASLAGAALVVPIADMTNSNLFNARMGPVAWLLLAVAVTYAALSARESRSLRARESRAPARADPPGREADHPV